MIDKNSIEEKRNVANAWLTSNDPSAHTRTKTGPEKETIKVAAVSVNPDQQTNVAASSAVVVGPLDYTEIDKQMRTALEEGDDAAVEEFKKHPLLGCTTVLDMARIASGYDPNGDMTAENTAKYQDYVKRVLECPFFHLVMNEHQTLDRQEESWEKAITEISGMFAGIADKDKSKISQAITNLAYAVASKSETQQGISLFSVSAIDSDAHTVEAYIYSSNIQMIHTSSSKSDSKQTKVDIYKTNLSFDVDMWPYYAEMVFKKHVELIDDWLADNNTEPEPNKLRLCIGKYKPFR